MIDCRLEYGLLAIEILTYTMAIVLLIVAIPYILPFLASIFANLGCPPDPNQMGCLVP